MKGTKDKYIYPPKYNNISIYSNHKYENTKIKKI
uniref:Uncharacterized protein n=1 Tax=viral metagenome TaxID=1070528 RepID=A0A6C0D453_9ZZZZ